MEYHSKQVTDYWGHHSNHIATPGTFISCTVTLFYSENKLQGSRLRLILEMKLIIIIIVTKMVDAKGYM